MAIYLTQPVPASSLERLRSLGQVELNPDPLHIVTKTELIDGLSRHEILVCMLHDIVDAEVIKASPRLKAIVSMAIIPALIDVALATTRGIPVTTIPPLVTDATADLHMALLLAVARRVVDADRGLRAGIFPGGQSIHFMGSEVSGKTLGIVGLGRIGEAVVRRARGFDMKLLYYKRNRLEAVRETSLGLHYRTLDELLAESDFVSVNVLLTPETVHIIGARELAKMKPTAFLINTSRGPTVDEKALVAALEAGRIAGAGLDVFEHEPRVDPALIKLPNVVLTPHIGSAARDTRERIAAVVVDNVAAVLAGRRPPNLFNQDLAG